MNHNFKIGNIVRISNKNIQQLNTELSNLLFNKIAKIIYIRPTSYISEYEDFYLLEFFEYVKGHDGEVYGERKPRGKYGHCWFLEEKDFELYISPLKKFLKDKKCK